MTENNHIMQRIEELLLPSAEVFQANSNCFGTLAYVLEMEESIECPSFIHASDIERHLGECEFGKEEGCIVAFYDHYNFLAHCGVYIGKENGHDMMFHQPGHGMPYSKDNINKFVEMFQELSYMFYRKAT